MLPGIQITFMIFCWVTILGCLVSVIYSIVDMIKDKHEKKQAKKCHKLSEREIRKIVEMAEKELSQQGDDNIHTDS